MSFELLALQVSIGDVGLTTPKRVVLFGALRQFSGYHACICGGNARCTTCRVEVSDGAEHLPEPSAMEAAA